jgi:hypothetical protein
MNPTPYYLVQEQPPTPHQRCQIWHPDEHRWVYARWDHRRKVFWAYVPLDSLVRAEIWLPEPPAPDEAD